MSPLPEDASGAAGMGAPPAEGHEPAATAPVLGDSRPFHAKRPHRKSRAGCQNCKSRKVKCDEARPRCRACLLRKEACVYPSSLKKPATKGASSSRGAYASAATAAASSSSSAASATRAALWASSSSSSGEGSSLAFRDLSRSSSPEFVSAGEFGTVVRLSQLTGIARRGGQDQLSLPAGYDGFSLVEEPLFRPMQIDTMDMKLLWFYTAKGYDAFYAEVGSQTGVDKVLQVVVPGHAFGNPFLMDCLLALSALELKLLNQPIDRRRELMYRTRAFAGYRKAVEEATPETFPALLACSLFLCALSSEVFRDAESAPLYILDWMVVWRGIGLIIKLMKPSLLFESGMAMLFGRPPIDLDASARDVPNQLLFLVSSIRRGDEDFAYIKQYYETLKYLGSLYRELKSGIGRILNLRIITWFTFLPKGFVDVARQRRPRALIILAHYLVFTKVCARLWWMKGIANKEIKDIQNLLGDEWKSFIAGPVAALETDDEIMLGKILLNNNTWTPSHFYDPVQDNRITNLSLVDNSGHNIIYNGAWVREDTGELVNWGDQEPEQIDMSSPAYTPVGFVRPGSEDSADDDATQMHG